MLPVLCLQDERNGYSRCHCLDNLTGIVDKVHKLKKIFKITKQSIVRKLTDLLTDLKDILNDNFVYLTNLVTRKINEIIKYKFQIQNMKLEIDDLTHKNLNLELKL
jgi:hypothetical protein